MYDYGECHLCGGSIEERLTTHDFRLGGELTVVIEDVPTGVCTKCGERVFAAKVAKQVESIAKQRTQFKNVRMVPVVRFDLGEVSVGS